MLNNLHGVKHKKVQQSISSRKFPRDFSLILREQHFHSFVQVVIISACREC